MPPERILVLGGTKEGRELAGALLTKGYEVITSLAGVTARPVLPRGPTRHGGFGGVQGLVQFVTAERIAAIADATHPFSVQMSRQAHEAARLANVVYVRLERLPWIAEPGDRWITVQNAREAAAVLPDGARVLLTIGRKDIAVFISRPTISGVARMIEAPSQPLPDSWTMLQARPPFTVDEERRLFKRYAISHVVAKNAGGEDTYAKIVAARIADLPVIMIQRPRKSDEPCCHQLDCTVMMLGRLLSP